MYCVLIFNKKLLISDLYKINNSIFAIQGSKNDSFFYVLNSETPPQYFEVLSDAF